MRRQINSESDMIYVKKHANGVLAACDENILGKKIKEGQKQLHVKESFYKGDLINAEEFTSLVSEHGNINLVGEETISAAGAYAGNVFKINKIPYAIIIKI